MPGRNLARRLAVALAAAGLLTAGLVLLLRALWLALAAPLGAIWANVLLGSGLVLLSAILLLILAARRPAQAPPAHLPRDQIVDLVVAFLEGVTAGRASNRDQR